MNFTDNANERDEPSASLRATAIPLPPSDPRRSLFSPEIAHLIYTTLLRPPPLRKLAQWIIRRFCIPEEIAFFGSRLRLNKNDAVVSGALALGNYETDLIEWLRGRLQPGDHFIDIGANIGAYSIVGAAAVGAEGRVLAVEPSVENAGYLRASAEANDLRNLDIAQCALGSENSSGQLFLCADNKGDHRIHDDAGEREGQPVDIRRLDDLLSERGWPRVDRIKMDIQGAEAMALPGMRETLAGNADIEMLMEFWPWGLRRAGSDPAALLADLRALGLRIHLHEGEKFREIPPAEDADLAGMQKFRDQVNLFMRRGGPPEAAR